MENVLILFSEIGENTKKILDETKKSTNPLAVIYRTTLEEQLHAIKDLMPFLKKNKPNLEEIKKALSIVYHDDDISETTYRAWKRAIHWQDESHLYSTEEIDLFFQKNKKNLKDAAKELLGLYDSEKIKYIVPTFYFNHSQKG
ncbi:MAG: hypothetical protein Q8906_02015 [Bacillota bacterium]|nr:hypothetical protein [Bacillota bacterium]MDP4169354.1 hypothetical protein [Bacillota bacterium]